MIVLPERRLSWADKRKTTERSSTPHFETKHFALPRVGYISTPGSELRCEYQRVLRVSLEAVFGDMEDLAYCARAEARTWKACFAATTSC